MADSKAYAAASIELASRLWVALEELGARIGLESECATDAASAVRLEALRLELLLVLDLCQSARGRAQLQPAQRLTLASIATDVLGALEACDSQPRRDCVHLAQNRLLDAVLALAQNDPAAAPAPQPVRQAIAL